MSSRAEGFCLAPAQIPQFWPHISGFVEGSCRRSGLGDFLAIAEAIHSGRMLAWIAWDGAKIIAVAVTQITTCNGTKIGTIVACSGSGYVSFGHIRNAMENHFRAEGCSASRIIGRKGWARRLIGYRIKALVLEKAL
jgi:hypothetical protein